MRHVASFFRGIFVLLKKDTKLYASKIISMLLLLLVLAAGAALALAAMLQNAASESETVLHMAVYDREPSKLTNAAISTVSKIKAVQELLTVEMCESEEEVRGGIKNGTYDAALIFEEGYYSKILDGNDSAVCILLSDKLTATADMIRHFASTGEKLIQMAEAGVEGTYIPLKEEYGAAKAREIINAMEINYALKLFSIPTESFNIDVVSYSGAGVGETEYYIICFIVFLMLVCEVVFFPYSAKDCEFSMLRRIKSYRVGSVAMIVEKAIIPFIIRALLLGGAVMLIGNFTDIDLSVGAVFEALLCVAMLSLFMSALTVLLSQSALGISIIFTLSTACLVLSGGIIPQSMLPYGASVIASYTPMGACVKMLAPLLCGKYSEFSAIYLFIVTVIATSAASMYMRRICKGGGSR